MGLAGLLAASTVLAQTPALVTKLTVDVASDQSTTVIGKWHSLAMVIEDLCWRGGADLRSYDAPDKPVAASISGRPLHETLAWLLRDESFVLGFRATASTAQQPLVAWVRVLGNHETARRRRSAELRHSSPPGIRLPPTIVATAFSGNEPQERESALALLSRRIRSDQYQRTAFLETDAGLIAETLRRYPSAASILAELRDAEQDGVLRAKLADVVSALEGRDTTAPSP